MKKLPVLVLHVCFYLIVSSIHNALSLSHASDLEGIPGSDRAYQGRPSQSDRSAEGLTGGEHSYLGRTRSAVLGT